MTPALSKNSELTKIVSANIDALIQMRKKDLEHQGHHAAFAAKITTFIGSIKFIYIHVAFYALWFAVNSRIFSAIPAFDPRPFVMLASISSIEAIFLATFILITQNRMQRLSEKRADLDVQINLLSEKEITQLMHLVAKVAMKLGVENDKKIEAFKEDIPAETVLDKIEEQELKHRHKAS
jgi:uncharacterized membrane protein